MALLSHPLVWDREAGKRLPVDFCTLLLEPDYQTVRYRAVLNRVDYERSDTFYGLGPKSPSDCVWIVPYLLPRRR